MRCYEVLKNLVSLCAIHCCSFLIAADSNFCDYYFTIETDILFCSVLLHLGHTFILRVTIEPNHCLVLDVFHFRSRNYGQSLEFHCCQAPWKVHSTVSQILKADNMKCKSNLTVRHCRSLCLRIYLEKIIILLVFQLTHFSGYFQDCANPRVVFAWQSNLSIWKSPRHCLWPLDSPGLRVWSSW